MKNIRHMSESRRYRMIRYRAVSLWTLVFISLAVTVPHSTLARPKQLVNGCSAEQIQSNFGNSCVDQMQQDLLNKKPYTHALLCNGSEVLCCTYDNATNQIQTCRKPAGSRLMPGMPAMKDPTMAPSGIKSRSL